MNRSEYFMTVAVMSIPLGVLLLIELDDIWWIGACFMATGMLAWIVGMFSMQIENKHKDNDRMVTNHLITEARMDIVAIINGLSRVNENTQNLIDEIRRDRNERNNPKPTDNDKV